MPGEPKDVSDGDKLVGKRSKHVQLRGRRTVEIPHLGVKVTDAPTANGHPGVLVEAMGEGETA